MLRCASYLCCMQIRIEEKLKRIRQISDQLQQEQTDLDQALALYNESIALIQACRVALDQANLQFEVLKKQNFPDGNA